MHTYISTRNMFSIALSCYKPRSLSRILFKVYAGFFLPAFSAHRRCIILYLWVPLWKVSVADSLYVCPSLSLSVDGWLAAFLSLSMWGELCQEKRVVCVICLQNLHIADEDQEQIIDLRPFMNPAPYAVFDVSVSCFIIYHRIDLYQPWKIARGRADITLATDWYSVSYRHLQTAVHASATDVSDWLLQALCSHCVADKSISQQTD